MLGAFFEFFILNLLGVIYKSYENVDDAWKSDSSLV